MTAVARFVLFLSSYAPLFGVFALLDSFGKGAPSIVCAAFAVVGLILPGLVFGASRGLDPQELHVATAQVRDGDALAYIATYLVPFAAVTATTTRERLALGVFVALIGVLYVRAELIYINPLLAVVGYRLFQVVTTGGTSVVLLSKRKFLPADSIISARRLNEYVYWGVNER